MTVYEMCNAYIEGGENMQIWSINKEETVFEGTFNDATYSDYSEEEVQSYGIENGIIVLNI